MTDSPNMAGGEANDAPPRLTNLDVAGRDGKYQGPPRGRTVEQPSPRVTNLDVAARALPRIKRSPAQQAADAIIADYATREEES